MNRPVFTVGILAIDGCMMSSIATATDTLRVAQTLAETGLLDGHRATCSW